jgi:hypothetical protein
MMMSMNSIHPRDSHPSGTMPSRLAALRMTINTIGNNVTLSEAKDHDDEAIEYARL